jgi:tRNA(fMet)-specific endonuclease VapC
MYLLDTNIVSLLISERRNNLNLLQQVLAKEPEHLFVSVITVEEILSGSLSVVNRLRHAPTIVNKYQEFHEVFEALQPFQIVLYTAAADQVYRSMTAQQKRVGTQDCRIAATAIALDYTVITANTADFMKIGGVRLEDWTR